jgi:hypothetical protein
MAKAVVVMLSLEITPEHLLKLGKVEPPDLSEDYIFTVRHLPGQST